MLFRALLLAQFALKLVKAQLPQPFNPLANPGCSTAYHIVTSCEPKLLSVATKDPLSLNSAVFSCICFDNSGDYVPKSYDDAAVSCADYMLSALHTTVNSFLQYAAGFCSDTAYATAIATNAVATTKADSVSVKLLLLRYVTFSIGLVVANFKQALSSSTLVANPGGPVKTSSPSPSQSALVTAPPPTASGLGSGAGAGGNAVISTSSKAEGATMVQLGREGSFWVSGSLGRVALAVIWTDTFLRHCLDLSWAQFCSFDPAPKFKISSSIIRACGIVHRIPPRLFLYSVIFAKVSEDQKQNTMSHYL